jgi:hypothetical protein
MNANRDEALPAALDAVPPNDDPMPFALRAETARQKAREAASADVQQILERGQITVLALRQRHALELLASETDSNPPRWPRLVVAGSALLTALCVCSFALVGRTQLSDDAASTFSPPELEVEMAIGFADSYAEREVANQPTLTRPSNGRHPRAARTACDPDSFDPIDACL